MVRPRAAIERKHLAGAVELVEPAEFQSRTSKFEVRGPMVAFRGRASVVHSRRVRPDRKVGVALAAQPHAGEDPARLSEQAPDKWRNSGARIFSQPQNWELEGASRPIADAGRTGTAMTRTTEEV